MTHSAKTDLWSSPENKRLIRQFSDKYAGHTVEKPGLRKNKTKIIEKLFEKMKSENLCIRTDYTGSAYTGLEIGPDREFDIQFVSSGKGLKMERKGKVGELFYLEATPEYKQHRDCLSMHEKKLYLDPKKLLKKFEDRFSRETRRICDELGIDCIVKQKQHGSAIQWDVSDKSTRQLLYSVDLVPSIEEGRPIWNPRVNYSSCTKNRDIFDQFPTSIGYNNG